MKTTQTTLRVSHLTYIRVMDALVSEVATLASAEAVALISAVTAYLHSADNAQAGDNEILRRYFDIIDRAALRSARARQAAHNRRKATELPPQLPAETPTELPTEAPTEVSTDKPTEIPVETSPKIPTQIQNPKFPIQNSKSHIQNPPSPSSLRRIKIKHKSFSANNRRRVKK